MGGHSRAKGYSQVRHDTGMSHSGVWFVAVALALVMLGMTQLEQVRQDHVRLMLTCYVGGFVVLNVALWLVGKAAGALSEIRSAKVYAYWGWTVLAAGAVVLLLFRSFGT